MNINVNSITTYKKAGGNGFQFHFHIDKWNYRNQVKLYKKRPGKNEWEKNYDASEENVWEKEKTFP